MLGRVEPVLSKDKGVSRHNIVMPVRFEPSVSSQALYHWATVLPQLGSDQFYLILKVTDWLIPGI